jgi:hypothetical protein
VDKNGPFSSLDIEVVVVVPGDGQVPHPPVVPLRGDAAVGGCQRAVRGLEVLTLRQFVRSNPLVQISGRASARVKQNPLSRPRGRGRVLGRVPRRDCRSSGPSSAEGFRSRQPACRNLGRQSA